MNPRFLNTLGLVLGIIGVIIIFVWGPPQPQLDTGVSIGIEDATPIDKTGKTVGEYNQEIIRRRNIHIFMSQLGLVLIMIGFAFQLWATWVPLKPTKPPRKPVTTDGSARPKADESISRPDRKDDQHNKSLKRDAARDRRAP